MSNIIKQFQEMEDESNKDMLKEMKMELKRRKMKVYQYQGDIDAIISTITKDEKEYQEVKLWLESLKSLKEGDKQFEAKIKDWEEKKNYILNRDNGSCY